MPMTMWRHLARLAKKIALLFAILSTSVAGLLGGRSVTIGDLWPDTEPSQGACPPN